MIRCRWLLMLVLASAAGAAARANPPPFSIRNPYEGVSWDTAGRHKANLHTHTRQSDGSDTPARVIDAYRNRGYTILALTDHDTLGPATPTWPWTRFGREPGQMGMLAVQGNELSRPHHIGSYFNDYGAPFELSEEAALKEIGLRNGLAVLFHPGRYSRGHGAEREGRTTAWHVALYRAFDHLLGMEVSNQGNRYPDDWRLWDELLMDLMPDRPVWGFANDDAHVMNHVGRDWQVFFLDALSEEALREAMRRGRFVFSHSLTGQAPELQSVEVDMSAGVIRIQAREHTHIVWTVGGNKIHRGDRLDLGKVAPDARYIRARLVGRHGSTYTQPFGVAPIRK